MLIPRTVFCLYAVLVSTLNVHQLLRGADCNGNGIDDGEDLLPRIFGALDSYAVGTNPEVAITADFNGDGELDLATANWGSNDVSVLFNKGDGVFLDAVSYPVGQATVFALLAADLNGDGKPDLAATSASCGNRTCAPGEVSVLFNKGNGSFMDPVRHAVGDGPDSLIAADLNGDGKPDLATGNRGSHDVSVLLSRSDETFMDAVSYPCGGFSPLLGLGLIVADLNGDLMPDLATNSGAVSVLINRGDGTFISAVSYSACEYASTPIAADLDGDGKQDLAIRCRSNVAILLNQGHGRFTDAVSYPVTSGTPVDLLSWIVSDLNRDGLLDIAVGIKGSESIPGGVSILFNAGHGTFTDSLEHAVGDSLIVLLASDIDGDGNPGDLVTLKVGCYGVLVLLNDGDGNFVDDVSYAFEGCLSSLIAIDLNDDGKPDLVGLKAGSNEVSVLLNHATAPFSLDINNNLIPDECELPPRPLFHRGDPNTSGTTDISDAIATFGFLFLGDTPSLACNESADSNNDGAIDISDGIYLLSWLFTGGPAPAAPGPTGAPCGVDPDPRGSAGDLGCETYAPCR